MIGQADGATDRNPGSRLRGVQRSACTHQLELPPDSAPVAPCDQSPGTHGLAFLVLLSIGLIGPAFLAEGHLGLGLGDESWLWEGVLKTRQGLLPFRDFHSYDPGRYYWSVAGTFLFGSGIVGLRCSLALFQLAGMVCGLLAGSRVVRSRWGLGLLGLAILCWMGPRHKMFEHTLALAAVYLAVRLVEQPDRRRCFLAGTYVGLAAFFGRNHGLYTLVAFTGLMLYLRWKTSDGQLRPAARAWGAGLLAGLVPLLAMMLFTPGWLDANLYWLADTVMRGHANTTFPIPVPWPWRWHATDQPWSVCLPSLATSLSFFLAPVVALLLLAAAVRTRPEGVRDRSVAVAAAFLGPCYLHHAFSRAGMWHLAQGAIPCVLGGVALMVLLSRGWQWLPRLVCATLLGLLSAGAAIQVHPLGDYLLARSHGERWQSFAVAGEQLWLPPAQIDYLRRYARFCTAHVRPGEAVFVAPFEPGLYTVLGQAAPVANSYPLTPASQRTQEKMIDDLRRHHVRWAILCDAALDGRPERQFRNTHPLVWHYLQCRFQPLADAGELPERIVLSAVGDKGLDETGCSPCGPLESGKSGQLVPDPGN